MKEQKIIDDNDGYVHIGCPHCEHMEGHPVDEQRHHIQTFDILKWEDDVDDEPEVSIMKCHVCKGEFKLIWEYNEVEQNTD